MEKPHKNWQAPEGACLSHSRARTDGRRDLPTMDTKKAMRLGGKKTPPFGVVEAARSRIDHLRPP